MLKSRIKYWKKIFAAGVWGNKEWGKWRRWWVAEEGERSVDLETACGLGVTPE